MATPPFLVDPLLPSQEVHLLAGDSDAGKTRFIIPAAIEWSQGKPIFGFPSTPVPWLYVAGDRTLRQTQRTVDSMGYNINSLPILPAFGAHRKDMIHVIMEASKLKAEFLIWEGFQRLVDPPGRSTEVTELLENLSCWTERGPDFPNGLTILGVVESPKMKPMERYSDPRQWVSGCASWGYYSSTIMIIVRPDVLSSDRKIYVCPKQGPRVATDGTFDVNNRLIFP